MNGYRNGHTNDLTGVVGIAGTPRGVHRPSFGESLVTAAKSIAHPLSRMDTAGGMYVIGVITGIGFGAAFVLWMTR